MATASAAPVAPLERLRTYASFVRFEHTLFSLPLILGGVFSAQGPALSSSRWAWIVVAAVGARTAALAINRLVDRRIDALNPRTAGRELPAGRMKVAEAWALLIGSAAAYLVACAALGPWYLKIAWLPLLAFTIYPYLKRITPLCHFGVGAALALSPLAGFAAAHPDLASPWPAIWLSSFAFSWVSGFDIIYATLDESFDRAHRVHSMVQWLGRSRALQVSAALHAIAFGCLIGTLAALRTSTGCVSLAAYVALAVAGALLFLEQRWAENVNLAFFKVNVWVGCAALIMVLAARSFCGGF